jgi:hypothetical protein
MAPPPLPSPIKGEGKMGFGVYVAGDVPDQGHHRYLCWGSIFKSAKIRFRESSTRD